jgi:hypothetical protein
MKWLRDSLNGTVSSSLRSGCNGGSPNQQRLSGYPNFARPPLQLLIILRDTFSAVAGSSGIVAISATLARVLRAATAASQIASLADRPISPSSRLPFVAALLSIASPFGTLSPIACATSAANELQFFHPLANKLTRSPQKPPGRSPQKPPKVLYGCWRPMGGSSLSAAE